MQLNDIVNLIDNASYIIYLAVLAFATLRSVTIGINLVNRTYRSRAFLVSLLIVFTAAQSFVPDSWSLFGLPIFELTYFVLIFTYLAVIDNSILVALDMDFFHRNTLYFRQARIVVYGVYLVFVLGIFASSMLQVHRLPIFVRIPLIGSFAALFFYVALTSVVAARRTQDTPMRRFLTYAAILIVATLVYSLINNYTYLISIDLFSDSLYVATAYLMYRMVMSLSLTGKVDRTESMTIEKAD